MSTNKATSATAQLYKPSFLVSASCLLDRLTLADKADADDDNNDPSPDVP